MREQILHGIRYRESKGHKYIHCHPSTAKKKGVEQYLHRQVWVDNFGTIPEGYHIHHIDNDRFNNTIENLECLNPSDHIKNHMQDRKDDDTFWVNTEKGKAHIAQMRELAKAWHSSEEGRLWHTQHYQFSLAKIHDKTIERNCNQCSKLFYCSKATKHSARFCSNACKSAFRRSQGTDNISKLCEYCGESFTHNKYGKRRFCSRQCSSRFLANKK
jgi:hypothetical protein